MKYPKSYFQQLAERWRERQAEQKRINALARRVRNNAARRAKRIMKAEGRNAVY